MCETRPVMSLRLALLLGLAAAGCAQTTPATRAPRPMFDVSRICDDPHYGAICEPHQVPVGAPAVSPIRVDTNLATPRSSTLART